ncbi:MAG: DNA alkylation repair protein [Chloroflexi bacterium]|nr:DNA alkylation repair protein [Chloroflexota bacterium]
MQTNEVLARLKALANPENVAGMARFGINPQNTYGISIPNLRAIAREADKDHTLALELWQTGIHEARLLACMVDSPKAVTLSQMEDWVQTFDSWDVCDQCCGILFDKTPWAYEKAVTWSAREEEFVKRAGFVLMTQLAVHDKKAPDEKFLPFLPIIYREATDERNFVKKAVNWALRQIGKRNARLNQAAIAAAKEIQTIDAKSARWIATDALRELTSEAVQRKIGKS